MKEAGRFVSSANTLYRKIRIYNEDNILPAEGDDGITVGKPSLVHESTLSSLNDGILNNSGKIDTLKDLSNDIVEIQKTQRNSRGYGHTIASKTPSLSTLKKSKVNLVLRMESLWLELQGRDLKGLDGKWLALLSVI